jgi:hypothetical protein
MTFLAMICNGRDGMLLNLREMSLVKELIIPQYYTMGHYTFLEGTMAKLDLVISINAP